MRFFVKFIRVFCIYFFCACYACDKNDYIFGECKWRNEKLDISVLREIKAKADVFGKKRNSTYFYLFSKSGFTEAVINEAKSDNNIILVDLNEIMSI